MDQPAATPDFLRRDAADRADLTRAVEDGIRRCFAVRRDRVRPFVDAHFSLRGSAAIHRAALGWDILRAPLNMSLALPQICVTAAAAVVRKLGATAAAAAMDRKLLLRTAVAARLEWLIVTELLELPYRQGARVAERDALAEAILADRRVGEAVASILAAIGQHGADPAFRERLRHAMGEYAATRAAASEIATGLLTLGAGALSLNKLTPGVVSLGPGLAAMLAQQAAIGAFPLGSGLGGLWYGLFPAAPSAALLFGLTGGLMAGATIFAAFAGMLTDPIQRRLGLHRRRLLRMLDALERQALDPGAAGFAVRDHYVARLLDLFDLLGAAWRLAHP